MTPYRSWVRVAVIVALAAVLLLPGGTARAASLDPSTSGSWTHLPSGLTFDAQGPPSTAVQVRPLANGQMVTIELGLALSDPSGLSQFLSSVGDPASPSYHQFLTSSEFAQRYAPSPAQQAQVEGYFAAHGAQALQPTADRMTLGLQMPAGSVPSAFGVSLAWYRTPSGALYYAPTGTPSLPPQIAGDLVQVDGLTSAYNAPAQTFLHTSATIPLGAAAAPAHAATKSSSSNYVTTVQNGQYFWGTDYPAVYGAQGLLNAGVTGNGWSVDTILWSGYNNTAGINLPPYDPSAVNQYLSTTFPSGSALPTITPEPVSYGGSTAPLPGSFSQGDDAGAVEENSLDLEMVASTAPASGVYCWYLPGSALTNLGTSTYGAFDQALSSALAFNYPGHGLAAISNSYGLPDYNDSTWNNLEAQAASQGVTLLVSSGDAGNAPPSASGRPQGQWPAWPSTASFGTYGAIAVGGTSILVSGTPYSSGYDPSLGYPPPMGYDANQITGLTSQTVWYANGSQPGQTAGTEGGISTYIDEPTWQAQSAAQSGIKLAAQKEGVPYARGVPDISSIGDETIIYTGSAPNIMLAFVSGTSVASPVMAGFVVLIDQQDGKQGFLDDKLYAIGSYFLTQAPTSAQDPFGGLDDVQSGANWVFNASVGWDPCTGWGTPDVSRLASDLTNPTYTGFVYNPNGVAGKAGGSPAPSSSGGVNAGLLLLVVVLAVVVIAVVVGVTLSRRKHQAPAPMAATYPHPAMMAGGPPYAAPPPAYAYGGSPPPAPGYGGGALAPPSAYPPPPGYAAPTYGPAYGAAPVYVVPGTYYPNAAAAPPGAVYYCRYCRNPRPYTTSPCPACGAPL